MNNRYPENSGTPGDDSAPQAAKSGDIAMPRALWGVVAGMVAGIIPLIALPAVIIIDRDFVVDSIMKNNPNLNPAHLDFAIYGVLIYTVVLHMIDVVLTLWFGVKALKGRQWARIALTAYLVIATFGSLYSAEAGTEYLWAVIPGDGIHIGMIILLWVPKSVRDFFAAHRSRAAAS